jgi:hypothetical protein
MTKQNTKQEEKQIEEEVVEIEKWDMSPEEIEGGMEFREKYFKRFGAFIRANLNELFLVNVETGEETNLKQPVKLVALYAHSCISLTQGIVSDKPRKEWTDDDAFPIAKTLLSPFGKKRSSIGSFKNGYQDWIADKEKYKRLQNRCWLYVKLKEWDNGNTPVICSFGSSAWHSFDSARKVLKMNGRHIATNYLNLTLEPDTNDDGKGYFKPTFKIVSNGSTCNPDEFADKFAGTIADLTREHAEEVADTEKVQLVDPIIQQIDSGPEVHQIEDMASDTPVGDLF